jgi:hypothetical protein
MARPRKDPEVYVTKLCQALALGAWYWQACHYAGVSYRTFHTWMGQAEQAAFAQRIRQAEAAGAVRLLGQIAAAAAHDWRAAAWLYDHQTRGPRAERPRASVGRSPRRSPGGDSHNFPSPMRVQEKDPLVHLRSTSR